ncbi:MAG TPA: DUF1990 family protein [Fimbriimonadaceae bacterium]|nr:DUF1990 family protein [Fimbriimonadaceae bacterium]
MTPSIRRRFDRYSRGPLTWEVGRAGKPALVSWEDRAEEDLGADPSGVRFSEISARMLGGRYYPEDALEFFGLWQDEGRQIRARDRILQRARVIPFLAWPVAWAMTEVFAVEQTSSTCRYGYLTTKRHFGRGIWQARLERSDGRLKLIVESVSGPRSWQFWATLPLARYLQRRAWRRAVEEFRKIHDRADEAAQS